MRRLTRIDVPARAVRSLLFGERKHLPGLLEGRRPLAVMPHGLAWYESSLRHTPTTESLHRVLGMAEDVDEKGTEQLVAHLASTLQQVRFTRNELFYGLELFRFLRSTVSEIDDEWFSACVRAPVTCAFVAPLRPSSINGEPGEVSDDHKQLFALVRSLHVNDAKKRLKLFYDAGKQLAAWSNRQVHYACRKAFVDALNPYDLNLYRVKVDGHEAIAHVAFDNVVAMIHPLDTKQLTVLGKQALNKHAVSFWQQKQVFVELTSDHVTILSFV